MSEKNILIIATVKPRDRNICEKKKFESCGIHSCFEMSDYNQKPFFLIISFSHFGLRFKKDFQYHNKFGKQNKMLLKQNKRPYP